MLTIRDKIETHINASPYLRDAIGKDLINMSSLARLLQPEIARELKKPVSVPAVFMALKRFAETIDDGGSKAAAGERLGSLALHADLVQLTVTNSERLMPIIGEIANRTRNIRSSYFVFNRGRHETSMVLDGDLYEAVESWLENERVTNRLEGLSAVSLHRSGATTDGGPGILHVPLQVLAWSGINVVDVISTASELQLIVHDEDAERAIAALRPTLTSKRSRVA